MDLLPHVPFSVERAEADVRLVQPEMRILHVCSLSGEGLDTWCQLLDDRRTALTAVSDARN
jgi:hydrogenase nickel incorporation protein HypB